ncbi:GNAT family N-acetyltransferase [Jannaschia sp. 2305UL9-9]|uniref:GNAT family N-acetyltransferase n=1 Tax=Jannaschia sp. 2305UL9-9 TaxID=3121638 RepID=UPI0035294F5B
MLTNGYHAVPEGKLAAVVTHLTMERPRTMPPVAADLPLRHVTSPDVEWYRDLFTRVGALDWLWVSRLEMPRDRLAAILSDPLIEVRALDIDGHAEGLLELDFRTPGTCELAFLGLTSAAQGKGFGRGMIAAAINLAFSRDVRTLTLHTCTFDSPWALRFYMSQGFVPVGQQVQVLDDPRLTGDLPRDAAPQIPMIGR